MQLKIYPWYFVKYVFKRCVTITSNTDLISESSNPIFDSKLIMKVFIIHALLQLFSINILLDL